MKQIEKTPEILRLMQKSVGEGVSLDDLVVFEASAYNTLPIRQKGSLYEGAVSRRNFLVEMQQALEAESIPLLLVHNKDDLPHGRVFSGRVIDYPSYSELRVLFFMGKEHPAVNDIERGILDQVSVSVLPQKLSCSTCGFDYLGEEADFYNLFDRVCENGHYIGKDGVHLVLSGLSAFSEMSLVARGGAQKARIRSRDESVFGETGRRLAASGINPNALVLTATSSKGNVMELDLSAHIKEMAEVKTELAMVKRDLEASTASLADATKVKEDLEAKLADLEAKLAEDKTETLEGQIAELTDKNAAAEALLAEVAKKITAISGQAGVEVPAEPAKLAEFISEKVDAFSAILIEQGRSVPADSQTKVVEIQSTAFKAARRKG